MNSEIICVGTELLLGDVINSNAATISRKLQELGIVGVGIKAPRDLLNERFKHAVAELRPAPGPWSHQWRQENSFAQLRRRIATQAIVQQELWINLGDAT